MWTPRWPPSIDVSSASVGMPFDLYALRVPRRLMENLALQNQSVEVPECCVEFRTNVTVPGNFFQRHCQLSYQNQEPQKRCSVFFLLDIIHRFGGRNPVS